MSDRFSISHAGVKSAGRLDMRREPRRDIPSEKRPRISFVPAKPFKPSVIEPLALGGRELIESSASNLLVNLMFATRLIGAHGGEYLR